MTSEKSASQNIHVATKQDWAAPLIITLQSSEAEGKPDDFIFETPGMVTTGPS